MRNTYLTFLIAGSLTFLCALYFGFSDLEEQAQDMIDYSILYLVVALHFKD